MRRVAVWLSVVVAALVCTQCARDAGRPTEEEAYQQLRDAYMEAETPAAKVEIAEKYLVEFPAGEHAPGVLDAAVYHLREDLGDLEAARALVERTLAGVEDPEARFEVQMTLWDIRRELGDPMPLDDIPAELATHRALDFGEHLQVAEAAVKVDGWVLARRHAEAALEFATAEAYRADYPDREFTDEEVAKRAAARRGSALALVGWAQANQGQIDDAVSTFSEAAAVAPVNFVGLADSPLYRYWGETELLRDNPERATELLARPAIMGGDDEAMEGLRTAYATLRGSDEGFDEFIDSTRLEIAPDLADARLQNYGGEDFALASTRGKVLLLAFWFPT